MKNELLHIGPVTVYGYGLMIATGVIAAYLTIEYRAAKKKLPKEHLLPIFLWCLAGGLLGAKLLFLITEWKGFLENPSRYLMSFSDGFVVYGGVVLGILIGAVYCRLNKQDFFAWSDLIMPSVALGQGFGRIGCFLAGCCYGKETDLPIGIVFRNSDFAPNGVRLMPTQLISAGADFLLFFVLLKLDKKSSGHGTVTAWYLVLYSAGRFLIEFLRGDRERGFVGILSTSQFISAFVFAGAILWLLYIKRRGAAAAG